MNITKLGLTCGVENALANAGIKSSHRLRQMSNKDLLAIKGIGPSALLQIRKTTNNGSRRYKVIFDSRSCGVTHEARQLSVDACDVPDAIVALRDQMKRESEKIARIISVSPF